MGLIDGVMSFLFGNGRNVVAETAEVFRENTEKGAIRAADSKTESLHQFAAEFALPKLGLFDRMVDALNRLPRPMLALGTIWMFVTAMTSPDTFIAGMEGIALVPEPLWWLMGAIVSFYFGARHQAKGQEFQRSVALSLAMAQSAKVAAPTRPDPASAGINAALTEWQEQDG